MKTYTYKQPMEIDSTEVVSILNESGETSSTVQRVYSNALKKAFDKTTWSCTFPRQGFCDGEGLYDCL